MTRNGKLIAKAKKEGLTEREGEGQELKTQGVNNRRTENVERGGQKRGKCNTAAVKEREIQHWQQQGNTEGE